MTATVTRGALMDADNAALDVLTANGTTREAVHAAISSVLGAFHVAPGFVWCRFGDPYLPVHEPDSDCPGPHSTLLINQGDTP
jgi:hypothetical protein